MTKPKLSPWFPATTRPVHIGVYDVADGKYFQATTFKHWNGVFWGVASISINDAESAKHIKFGLQDCFHWRGLVRKQHDNQ